MFNEAKVLCGIISQVSAISFANLLFMQLTLLCCRQKGFGGNKFFANKLA